MIAVSKLEEEVRAMVEKIIEDQQDLFIVKVMLKGGPGNQKLIILLDGDEGVTIDQCSQVSRELSALLEERELITDKYNLEVSSAGIDHPLEFHRQYVKNKGRKLRVLDKTGHTLEGILEEVKDDSIVLKEKVKKDTRLHEIEFDEINKTMVLVSFK